MSEAIDRVSAFVDAHENQWGTGDPLSEAIDVSEAADGKFAPLLRADLREVLRLARIGAEVVQRREVIIGALGPCGDAYHDPAQSAGAAAMKRRALLLDVARIAVIAAAVALVIWFIDATRH